MNTHMALKELESFEALDLSLSGVAETLLVHLLEFKGFLSVGHCTTSSEQEAALAIVAAGSAGFVFDGLGIIAALQDMLQGATQLLIDGTAVLVGILAIDLDLSEMATVSNACHLS